MTPITHLNKSLALCAALISLSSHAQNQPSPATESISAQADTNTGFALFEDIEANETRTRNSRTAARESRVTTATPEFTLVGTSRIAGTYSAILKHSSGEDIVVKSSGNGSMEIPAHNGYRVQNIASGNVLLRYPGGIACVPFPDQGVTCDSSTGFVRLELSNAEPIQRFTESELSGDELNAAIENSDTVIVNGEPSPFQAVRDARAELNDADQSDPRQNRFTPRRIDPDDVPPGMRVVSTPFGDRLVEQ